MGPARRNNTNPIPWTPYIPAPSRNLKSKQLGAVIFGCKKHTIRECLFKQLFGLPATHFHYVKNIAPGLTLFLFNYTNRTLHGIYEAKTPGLMNINPYAWTTSEGTELTPFAAQVRVGVRNDCRQLHEDEFRPIIADNYYEDDLFMFELDKGQTKRLTNLFLSPPLATKIPRRPNVPSWDQTFHTARSESYKAIDHTNPSISAPEKKWNDLSSISAPEKKWNDLSSISAPEKKWSDLFTTSDHASSSRETVKPIPESCSEAVTTEYDLAALDNWEEPEDSDSNEMDEDKATSVQDLERDNDDTDITDAPSLEDENFWDSVAVAEEAGKPLSIWKLMEEINGLKASQLKQSLKIESLEHELAHLKKFFKLEPIPPYSIDHCDEGNCESPCLKTEEFVLIVGGFDGTAWLPSLDSYSPSEDNVTSLCPMTFLRSYAAVAKSKGELYIFGGANNGVWFNTVESYNPMSNQWVQCAPLNRKKGSLTGASLNDKIYAIGGGDGVDCFSEVELFDINHGQWIFTQPMMEKRFAAAATDMNGALYVAGGYDGKNYLRSVERFDPRESAWTRLSNMSTNRGSHSVVAFKERIYALGGYDGSAMVSTVEVFDPRVGLWMKEEPMSVSRGYFGSFVFEGKLFAIGGVDGTKTFDVVECYEEGYGWQTIGRSAIGKRCYFSSLTF